MHSFFLDNFVFQIVVLTFVYLVLAWAWVLMKSLLCVRSFAFISPKISSLRFIQETLGFNQNPIFVDLARHDLVLHRERIFILPWTKISRSFSLLVFAVRNFGLENAVLTVGVELFLTHFSEIVFSRSWVFLLLLCRYESFSFFFASLKINILSFTLCHRVFWIVCRRPHLVHAAASVRSLRYFFRRNALRHRFRDH